MIEGKFSAGKRIFEKEMSRGPVGNPKRDVSKRFFIKGLMDQYFSELIKQNSQERQAIETETWGEDEGEEEGEEKETEGEEKETEGESDDSNTDDGDSDRDYSDNEDVLDMGKCEEVVQVKSYTQSFSD